MSWTRVIAFGGKLLIEFSLFYLFVNQLMSINLTDGPKYTAIICAIILTYLLLIDVDLIMSFIDKSIKLINVCPYVFFHREALKEEIKIHKEYSSQLSYRVNQLFENTLSPKADDVQDILDFIERHKKICAEEFTNDSSRDL